MNRVSLSVIIGVPNDQLVPISWIATPTPTPVGDLFDACPDITTIYQQYGYLYSREIRRLATLRSIDMSRVSIPMHILQESVDSIFALVKWLKIPAHIGTRGIQYFFTFIRLAMPHLQDSSDQILRTWLKYLLERDLHLLASICFVLACKFELGIGVNQEVLQHICHRSASLIPPILRAEVIPKAFLDTYPDIQPQDIGVRTPWQSFWIFQAVENVFLRIMRWDLSHGSAHDFAQYFLINAIHHWQPYEERGEDLGGSLLDTTSSQMNATQPFEASFAGEGSMLDGGMSTGDLTGSIEETDDERGLGATLPYESSGGPGVVSRIGGGLPIVSHLPIIPFSFEQQIVAVSHLTHCFITCAALCPTFVVAFEDQSLVACASLRCAVTMLNFDDEHWKVPILNPMCVVKQRDASGEVVPDELARTEYIGGFRLKKIDYLSTKIMEQYIRRRQDCITADGSVFPDAALWTWPLMSGEN